MAIGPIAKRPASCALSALALLQAFALVASIALPALHRATASHAHVYCPVHELFEDVAADVEPGRNNPGDRGSLDVRRAASNTHVACAFSNLSLWRPHLCRSEASKPAGCASPPRSVEQQPAAPALPIAQLRLAPKQSPPTRG